MLCHLVQLLNGTVDLPGTGILLTGRRVDLLHQLGCLFYIRYYLIEHLAGLDCYFDTAARQFIDLSGCYLASLSQFSDFGGYDGEPFTVLTRAGCLNGSVECQKICLAGNFLYDVNLLCNVLHG